MHLKKFEFTNKDIPFLKKDIVWRLSFTAMFCAIFIWQFIAFIVAQTKGLMSTGRIVATIFVLVLSLMLAFIGFIYSFKDIRIVAAIQKRGSCVSTVDVLFSIKKNSFIRLYDIVCQVLAYVSLFVLLCSITSMILNAAFYSTISYYMPILILLCVSGFNGVLHIKSEIKTMQTVLEYQSFH